MESRTGCAPIKKGYGIYRNPLRTGSKGRIRTADPGIMSAVL